MTSNGAKVTDKPIRVAFGSVPKDGGTFTFYRNSRPALRDLGVDLRCVTVGKDQAALVDDRFWDEGCVLLAETEPDLKRQAMAFSDWCDAEDIDTVIGVNSHAILSSIPHLSPRIRTIARCANGFDEGYQLTLVGRDRLMRIIALVPKLRDDLINTYGVDPGLIELIPNGVDPTNFTAVAQSPRGQRDCLELGFVGRLEHRQKGVLHIPAILAGLRARGVPYRLRIIGRGKHEEQLRADLADQIADGSVVFLGSQPADEVARFLGDLDIFLFPSHFEGCPNALLEALMAGAVPASWRLPGITDYIIEDGVYGHLAEVGDHEGLSAGIAELHADRERLQSMSKKAAEVAMTRFHNQVCAARYVEVFKSVLAEPLPTSAPAPWTQFRAAQVIAPSLPHRLRSYIQRRWFGGKHENFVVAPPPRADEVLQRVGSK
ncbi:MAG: glycosyltransferase family 4 protein [Pseudomonadota bacterium]